MKAQELRIGNYVLFAPDEKKIAPRVCMVTETSLVGVTVSDLGLEVRLAYSDDELLPIPLTAEWCREHLVQEMCLRFNEDDQWQWNIGSVILIFDPVIADEPSPECFVYSCENPKIPIRFVHEFQNLCKEINRKDLEVKL